MLVLTVSASALNWNLVPSGTAETLYDANFANGTFVAVGSNGTILTSPSGGVWSPQASGTTVVLNGVASSNGAGPPGGAEWVVVGHSGTALYSTAANASTWAPVPAGGLPPGLGTTLLEQVTYGGPAGSQLFVAVGWNGTIITSPDGLNWNQPSSGTAANLADVEYAAGQYVIAGWNGTLLTSPNGSTWTAQASGTAANLYDLAYGAGTWVAVGAGGTILTSPNGVNWGAAASGTTYDPYDIIYDGCQFVASGAGSTILTSPDGANWAPDASGSTAGLFGLAAGNGVKVAVGTAGTALVAKGCQPSGGACAPLPAGAVAWWPLNETSGATAVTDVVGGHTGTPLSGPVGSGGPNPTTGMVGGALYFPSQSTYVRVPDSPALNFGSGDFTVDAWVNTVVGPGTATLLRPILDKFQAGAQGDIKGYRLYIDMNNQLTFVLADGSSTASVSVPVTPGTWQFVAAERAGAALNLYINGSLAATAPLPPGFGSVSNTADLLVGSITGVGFPFQPPYGEIALDELELFNRALTAQEVQAIYNAGPAGKCPPADLQVQKTHLTSPVVAGQPITYQITVTNVGGSPWTGWIGVSDPLPAGAANVSYAAPPPWSCSVSGGVLMCTYNGGPGFSLQAGQSLPPITLTFTVPAGATSVKNCARVFAQNPDANPANNLSCDMVDVQPAPPPPGGKCVALPTGAVAWWPLDEQVGATSVADNVPGGPVGTPFTLPGVPTAVGSLFGPKAVAGMVNGALLFDRDDWVQVPNSPAINFGTGSFTVDAWVYAPPQSPLLYQAIADKVEAVSGGTGAVGFRLYIKNGTIHFDLSDGSLVATVTAPGWYAYGTWEFVAGEVDRTAGTVNLYVNGVLAATAPLPPGFGSVNNSVDLLLGQVGTAGSPPGPNPSDGWIALDELELFNRALTAQEVQAIYNAGPAGKCPPGAPDLAVTKVQQGPAVVGMTVYYQVYVANVGTAAMPGPITVTDNRPAGTVLLAAGGPPGSGWSCTPAPPPPVPGPATVTCTHPGPVPAGGSLPPITLAAKVTGQAVKPGSLTNCASVAGPAGPTGAPLDPNPANDKSCVTSAVGWPGALCGVKWRDDDGDGVHDSGEPGLSGWTIEVRDANGNLVATATTGKGGRYCIKKLPPGTYTVSEVPKPGWIQTAPQPVPPGTHTVTVGSGQTVTGINFGNRPRKIGVWYPIGVPVTLPAGSPDLWVGKYVYDFGYGSGCFGPWGSCYAQVVFGLDVTNVGNAPTPAPFILNDAFPAGFTVISITAPGWSCTPGALPAAGPVTVSCSFAGSLAPGQTAHLEITAQRPLGSIMSIWVTNCAALAPNPWDASAANDQACIQVLY